ncbi:hypothetical protein QCA50_006426 [Cerrena zonata]|uniref:Uncharacterized protein n=1 Tax=Cerrena zonata TaxID=2478898 RepID=A0AAW0GIP6_9APHY
MRRVPLLPFSSTENARSAFGLCLLRHVKHGSIFCVIPDTADDMKRKPDLHDDQRQEHQNHNIPTNSVYIFSKGSQGRNLETQVIPQSCWLGNVTTVHLYSLDVHPEHTMLDRVEDHT